MTDELVLKSRGAAPAMSAGRDQLDVRMQTAVAIARAGEMLPKAYRNQPGAILLAIDWAERHDLSVMDALHGVSWVHGRPVVDSTLQRAMARNAGYDVRVVTATAEQATVHVLRGTEVVGSANYTIDEARAAGLTGKDNWKKHPADMLVARATTRAIKWFCAEALIGGAVSPEELDEIVSDPVQTIVPPAPSPPVVSGVPAATNTDQDDVTDAEVIEDEPETVDLDDKATPATRGAAKAALDGCKGNGTFKYVAECMAAETIALASTKWTERQALRIVRLAEIAPTAAEQ